MFVLSFTGMSWFAGYQLNMKCDLHIHTTHSGMCTVPVMDRVCRECYTQPEAAYRKLKGLGMDLVTVTDHDSIGAVQELGRYSDFFLSQEVTVTTPSGGEAHVGVYDITERQHVEIQARRNDLPRLIAYLNEQQRFFSINHVFSSLTGARTVADFELFEREFPALEARNAAMLRIANRSASKLARRWGKTQLAGSDAHALGSIGRAYTVVPGARNRDEFFAGLRAGNSQIAGGHGSYFLLTAEVLSIVGSMIRENPASLALAPLAALIPLVVLGNYGKELIFAHRWRSYFGLGRGAEVGAPVAEAAG